MTVQLHRVFTALASLVLAACAQLGPGNHAASAENRIVLPGGSPYSWGWSQKPEGFANVEQAQSGVSLHSDQLRQWLDVPVNRTAASTILGLETYYPMHVRWKLKDGREFIVDHIDTAKIMSDYFRSQQLKLPWQLEGRKRDLVGDSDPVLAHEVKDDTVLIKWVIRFNRTPVDQRLGAGGIANRWKIEEQEHLVAVIKGRPTSGIDFNQVADPNKPGPAVSQGPGNGGR